MVSQLLENSFYSKDTSLHMARFERVKIFVYVVVWLVCVLNRSADLAALAIAAQILFSEQILSRWLRLEWSRMQYERIYDEAFHLLRTETDLEVVGFDLLGRYEVAKATSGITLSQKIFERRQSFTDTEWKATRQLLNL